MTPGNARAEEEGAPGEVSPTAASPSLTRSSLKAHLDASRRPPHKHHVRRVASSNLTPMKKQVEEERVRPKTVATTRSTSRSEQSPCRSRHSPSPDKCAAPTPPPSRSNSTASSAPGGKTATARGPDQGHATVQPSSRSSPKKKTPSKLKLRDSLSPMKASSPSSSPRSSPGVRIGGDASPRKRDNNPRPMSACASPPKRTPSKLKLKRSTPTTDLATLGRSPSPKSPSRSTTRAGTEQGNTASPSRRKTHKDSLGASTRSI